MKNGEFMSGKITRLRVMPGAVEALKSLCGPRVGSAKINSDAFDLVKRGAIIKVKIAGVPQGEFRAYYRRKKDKTIFFREVQT